MSTELDAKVGNVSKDQDRTTSSPAGNDDSSSEMVSKRSKPESNLTLKRVVKYRSDTSPLPNHALVICRKVGVGDGFRIHRTLDPGKRFKPFLPGSTKRFFAYAVLINDFYSFTKIYAIPAAALFVRLNFALNLEVEDPEVLIRNVDADPLRTLQWNIEDLFTRMARHLPWISSPATGSIPFESFSLFTGGEVEDSNIAARSLSADLHSLQADAILFGLKIIKLQIIRDLTEEEHAFLKEKQRLRHERDLQGDRISMASDIEAEKRRQRVDNTILDHALQVLGRAAGRLSSIPELKRAAAELVELQTSVQQILEASPAQPILLGRGSAQITESEEDPD